MIFSTHIQFAHVSHRTELFDCRYARVIMFLSTRLPWAEGKALTSKIHSATKVKVAGKACFSGSLTEAECCTILSFSKVKNVSGLMSRKLV